MNQKHIQHLYNRAGFGITYKNLDSLKSKTKKDIVSNLFSDSKQNVPLNIDLSEFEIFKTKSDKQLKLEFGKEEIKKLKRKSRKKVRELNYAWIKRLSEDRYCFKRENDTFLGKCFCL